MTRQTGVVVVGGGATGASVARDLALRGVDVTLVERGPLTAGTTGRSHGLLHSGARYADADPDGAAECLRENRVLREIAGACVADTGGFVVELPGDPDGYFDEKLAACRDVGIPTAVVPGDELAAAEPVTPAVERAVRVPDRAVYPSRLVAATAADARDHGAAVETHTAVRDVLVEDGRVAGVAVERDDGAGPARVEADHVVNAAGPWAGRVAALADCEVAMQPTTGVMAVFAFDRLDSVLNRCRPPADGDVVVPHADRVVVGTTSVAVDDPDECRASSGEVARLLAAGRELLPALSGGRLRRRYCGVRPLYAPEEAGEGRGISRGFHVLAHGERDGRPGFTTVAGGKLTTCRLMAEAAADGVCRALGVDEPCLTAERRLPGAEDPAKLDRLVGEFGRAGPADRDVVGDPGSRSRRTQ